MIPGLEAGFPISPPHGSPEERSKFLEVQGRLAARFNEFRADPRQPYTAVVIPSQSFDRSELEKIEGVAHYEERSLFNLMLLRRPQVKVVFVSSKRLDPLIIDYYLHQIRGVPTAHARRRLVLLDCDDASPRPLAEKVLRRPRLLQRIRDRIDDRDRAHMVVFNSSPLERTLAVQLGIPMFASEPELVAEFGSKTGSRTVFREAGISMPKGREDLHSEAELVDALGDLWEELGTARKVVVKLNDSFSGEGNAILDLTQIEGAAPGKASPAERRSALRNELPNLRFEAKGLTYEAYIQQMQEMGGICEQWIEGERKSSPSVQMRINPVGEVYPVSTHDQVLGGPGGQIFMGATFPADPQYRLAIQDSGRKVGDILSARGIKGRFAVDFVASYAGPDSAPELFAIEINLRQGGTTHPFNTLKFITDGEYDEESGVFRTAQGRERSYFATDTLVSEKYCGILPFDLLDRLVVEDIHFRSDETGIVFHLLGCLSEFGKLGCTSIGSSVPEAIKLYDEFVAVLDAMAKGNR